MMTLLLSTLAPLVVGYVVDRVGYSRTIAKHAAVLVHAMPNKTARQIAEQAIILANQREIDREVAKQARAAAQHADRMRRIEAGEDPSTIYNGANKP